MKSKSGGRPEISQSLLCQRSISAGWLDVLPSYGRRTTTRPPFCLPMTWPCVNRLSQPGSGTSTAAGGGDWVLPGLSASRHVGLCVGEMIGGSTPGMGWVGPGYWGSSIANSEKTKSFASQSLCHQIHIGRYISHARQPLQVPTRNVVVLDEESPVGSFSFHRREEKPKEANPCATLYSRSPKPRLVVCA
jgi:hypothetical protein